MYTVTEAVAVIASERFGWHKARGSRWPGLVPMSNRCEKQKAVSLTHRSAKADGLIESDWLRGLTRGYIVASVGRQRDSAISAALHGGFPCTTHVGATMRATAMAGRVS